MGKDYKIINKNIKELAALQTDTLKFSITIKGKEYKLPYKKKLKKKNK